MNKVYLVFNTLRHLKLKQVFFQIKYRLIKPGVEFPGREVSLPSSFGNLIFSEWIRKDETCTNNEFTFLNLTKEFPDQIDWNFRDHGMLWNYNLNYMDYLLQPGMTAEKGLILIKEYMDQHDRNSAGMNPYPISLRGINWIKFISGHKIQNRDVDLSLYNQYKVLNKSIEYHLLGNHLLENGFSLLLGAYYFNNHRFFRKASKIITEELKEQVLNDGGHFELSPMYHRILLDRLLDCINLVQNNSRFNKGDHLLSLMKQKAGTMVRWMNTVCFSNGALPLLNDSANKIAPATADLNEYAGRLGIMNDSKAELQDSGYRVFEGDSYKVIADVGNIGASYQPGHGHADTFNFELFLGNKPIIVDTGISTYEKNGRRQIERSTISHNTVEVNNTSSSEVWGGFRVGKRAKVTRIEESNGSTKARHNGYKRYGVIHEREFIHEPAKFIINDQLHSINEIQGTSRFHFHPDIFIKSVDNKINFEGGCLEFENAGDIKIEEYFYAPEFNKTIPAKVVEVRFSKNLKSSFHLYRP